MNKEDKILNSLGGLQKAAAPDFFYTRLIGRMENDLTAAKKNIWLLRPVFVTTILFTLLLVNIFSIINFNKLPAQKTVTIQSAKPATVESFAQAYNLNTESVYE